MRDGRWESILLFSGTSRDASLTVHDRSAAPLSTLQDFTCLAACTDDGIRIHSCPDGACVYADRSGEAAIVEVRARPNAVSAALYAWDWGGEMGLLLFLSFASYLSTLAD